MSLLSPSPRLSVSPSRLLSAALALLLLATALASASEAPTPPRLKRADSFLGIHFDFHAGPDCTEVGKNTTPAMIQNIIDLVRPDYLQIDCKGHAGYTSYPTQVGQQVPGYVGDPLRTWRDVTAKNGVALYMHYSGVWDSVAVKNPGWAALDADGKPSPKATSFWGPYSEQLLIPQLRELAGTYGVDGVWVDGECWASIPDYSPAALAAFTSSTGFTTVPRKASEPHWFEFLQFQREAFRGYLRHYLAAVKRTHPTFQICSNWAFTDHMPEPVSVPVDFLSGDYSPDDSVNSARLSARLEAHGQRRVARQCLRNRRLALHGGGVLGKTALRGLSLLVRRGEEELVEADTVGAAAHVLHKLAQPAHEELTPLCVEAPKRDHVRKAA